MNLKSSFASNGTIYQTYNNGRIDPHWMDPMWFNSDVNSTPRKKVGIKRVLLDFRLV